MLASTMQFSRYGRSRQPSRRAPRHAAPAPENELRGAAQRGRSAGSRS